MSKDLTTPILKKSAVAPDGVIHYLVEGGMTKRELFAAMAMQGILAESGTRAYGTSVLAEWATSYADALLEELSK